MPNCSSHVIKLCYNGRKSAPRSRLVPPGQCDWLGLPPFLPKNFGNEIRHAHTHTHTHTYVQCDRNPSNDPNNCTQYASEKAWCCSRIPRLPNIQVPQHAPPKLPSYYIVAKHPLTAQLQVRHAGLRVPSTHSHPVRALTAMTNNNPQPNYK